MPAETTVTGRIAEPSLRFTQSGKAVLELNIYATPTRRNPQTNEWEDVGAPLWIKAPIWEKEAERWAEILNKGDRVSVTGQLTLREWTSRDGKTGTTLELNFPRVLGYAPKPAQQQSGWQQPPQGGNAWHAQQAAAQAPAGGQAGDPWRVDPQPQQQGVFEDAYAQQPNQPSGNTAPPF